MMFTDTAADKRRRARMVRDYLDHDTDERVRQAMADLPRHWFCGDAAMAYADSAFPIGAGQTISQPRIVANMLTQLQIQPGMTVLDVGCGSGYAAALLASLVGPSGRVYSVERQHRLIARAQNVHQACGIENCSIHLADGFAGWYEASPFNAIHVACAAPGMPNELEAQLADDGRLVIPIGEQDDTQKLLLAHCQHGKVFHTYLEPVIFVPMLPDITASTSIAAAADH